MTGRQAPKEVRDLRDALTLISKEFKLIGDFPSSTMVEEPVSIINTCCNRYHQHLLREPPVEGDLQSLHTATTVILENMYKETLEKATSMMAYTVSEATRSPSDRFMPYFPGKFHLEVTSLITSLVNES